MKLVDRSISRRIQRNVGWVRRMLFRHLLQEQIRVVAPVGDCPAFERGYYFGVADGLQGGPVKRAHGGHEGRFDVDKDVIDGHRDDVMLCQGDSREIEGMCC